MSDHSGRRYLFDQPNLNASKHDGWILSVSLILRLGKGKDNRVADSLSRRFQVNHILVVSSYDSFDRWKASNQNLEISIACMDPLA